MVQRFANLNFVLKPMPDKASRTALHQAIRTLFGGKFESEVDSSAPKSEAGTRIMIRWNPRATKKNAGKNGESYSRPGLP